MRIFGTAMPACLLLVSITTAPAQAAGTHFLVEGQVAGLLTDSTDLGQASTLVLGVGGGFRRLPMIRLYFTGQAGFDWFDARRARVAADAEASQREVLYAFGPRAYLAFTPRIRMVFDLLLGGYWARSQWTLNGLETYAAVDEGFSFVAGLGLQYRVLEALSIGLRVDRCEFLGRTHRRNLAAFLGFPEGSAEALLARTRFGLTVTAHF